MHSPRRVMPARSSGLLGSLLVRLGALGTKVIYELGLTVWTHPGAARSTATPQKMVASIKMLPAQRTQQPEPKAIILNCPESEAHACGEDNDF